MRQILAAVRFRGLDFRSPYYYLGLGILVILMVIALVKAHQMWEELHDVEEPDSPTDLLESFEHAHAAGELDDEEFERVRQRLAGPRSDGDEKSAPADHDNANPDAS
jgi:hypothetical protein